MKKINLIIFFIVWVAAAGCAHTGQLVRTDQQKVSNDEKGKQGETLLSPIKFYQDYISRVDGDRCVMYPTCSQYCSQAIKKHGPLLGWIMCSDRLIRGGRDETRLSAPVWVNGERRTYDPVSNNDFWWQ